MAIDATFVQGHVTLK